MTDILAWIAAHESLAAWVQAIGSILAIIAAFLIPFLMARRDRTDFVG